MFAPSRKKEKAETPIAAFGLSDPIVAHAFQMKDGLAVVDPCFNSRLAQV
jgi:hypothetical protein